jgi:hypothetical protein
VDLVVEAKRGLEMQLKTVRDGWRLKGRRVWDVKLLVEGRKI